MKFSSLNLAGMRGSTLTFFVCSFSVLNAHAGLFDDDEARKAILDLRQQVEQVRGEVGQVRALISTTSTAAAGDNAALGKSLLDLQRQIEVLKQELAVSKGKSEELARELAELQRAQKGQQQVLEGRIKLLEPISVKHEGAEFVVEPSEKREFEAGWAAFRKGDFSGAQTLLYGFVSRFPTSGYTSSALFWLANAQYATRDYKEAIDNFRTLITKSPDHPRASEALLSIANCQIELKDSKAARKSLNDLIKSYPQSEAAVAAKERLTSLK
jgi:tol-pal system protein YbgF